MESWRQVWREGAAPLLSVAHLEALKRALGEDDPRLIQGATTVPPALANLQGWPIEAACVLGYCGWQGDGLETVGLVEKFWADCCRAIDRRVGEPAGCRHFLNWFDDTPRVEVRRELLVEVERTLQERKGGCSREN